MEHLSGLHLFGLTSTNFAFGFMIASQGLLLAPRESEHLFPGQSAIVVSAAVAFSGFAQMMGPAVGRWSDIYRASEGRRMPCLIKTAIATVLLTALLPVLSSMRWRFTFLLCVLLQQIAWMSFQTVQIALVPDLVPVEQRGTAGGLVACLTLAGAFTALLAMRVISHEEVGWEKTVDYIHYYIGLSFTLVCTLVTLVTSMTQTVEESRKVLFASSSSVIDGSYLSCYRFDWERYPEFGKLLCSKACYSANVAAKSFLLFFVQDTFRFSNKSADQVLVGKAAIAAEAVAGLTAGAAIWYLSSQAASHKSAEVSIRARRTGVWGAAWMSLLWLGPPAVGFGVLHEMQTSTDSPEVVSERWQKWMVLGTTVWGLGQGIYLAGDQTLGYSLLPDRNEASRYLGITGVFAAIGGMLGAGFCGSLLFLFGTAWKEWAPIGGDGPGYGYPGYLALFGFALAVNAVACCLLTSVNLNPKGVSENTRILKGEVA